VPEDLTAAGRACIFYQIILCKAWQSMVIHDRIMAALWRRGADIVSTYTGKNIVW
jgi:hypothetical protein